jgi:hypothetical protein
MFGSSPVIMTTQACEVYGKIKTQDTPAPWIMGVLGMSECLQIAESVDG